VDFPNTTTMMLRSKEFTRTIFHTEPMIMTMTAKEVNSNFNCTISA
jgi:hypothetical protein